MAQVLVAPSSRAMVSETARPAILIVEDERIVARDIAMTLGDLGYLVLGTASSGEEALRMLAQRRPDLILMDVRIQGEMDGIELASTVKRSHQIPVIFLTANGDRQTLGRAVEGEPDGYVLKPFSPHNLQTAIEVALRRDALRRELKRAHDELSREKAALEARNAELAALAEMGHLMTACESEEALAAVVARVGSRLFAGAAGVVLVAGAEDSRQALACWGGDLGPDPFSAPIVAGGLAVGELRVSRAHGSPVEMATIVSQRLGLALEAQRLRGRLRMESIVDPLTSLYNRRYMDDALERELRLAVRSGRSVSVVMIDLDEFKQVNDQFGHAAGDAVLKAVAELIRARIRSSDIPTRLGGDELLLVLPDTPAHGARQLAEEILRLMGKLGIEQGGRTLPPVRASMGVAAFPAHGGDAASVLHAADEAVYRAKAAGRGCVRSAGDDLTR